MGAALPPPHGGGSEIYEQAKSNAINNYNGILKVLGNQINVLAAIGTASSPIDVGEIVLNPPIRAVSNNNLATCSYCMTSQGKNLREQLNIPGPPKVQSIDEAQRLLKPVLHNGSAYMMSGDMFGFTDLLGVLFSSIKPENQEAAMGLAAIVIVTTKGRAAPAILRAEATGAYYSVAFEMKLAKTSYPGVTSLYAL
ncbi:hypothetical protein DRF59_19980 [Chryseobacterium flavum]|uniref:Uncharacterized protein n=1 Tax=Chryseobacterium flavum TaxID=415851 RepID=A0A3D9CFU3_9FLAO|nr:hypothetical protein [Chryseobacterium flavum]REC64607.1 hypothetical protein DRF59_19980 [Chryseobacterium flavum]